MIKKFSFLIAFLFTHICTTFAETYNWTGTISSSWAEPGNWDKNNGILPGPTDDVVISNVVNKPLLDQSVTIYSIVITNSELNLAGNTITLPGFLTSNASKLLGGGFIAIGSEGAISEKGCRIFSSTVTSGLICNATGVELASSIFDDNINFTSGYFSYRLNTFNGMVSITKTGASQDMYNGGNVFKEKAVITHKGAGYFMPAYLFGGDRFEKDADFTNEGPSQFIVSFFSKDNIYNGITTFTNRGTGGLSFSNGVGTAIFNGDVIVNCIGGAVTVGGYNGSLTTFNGNIHINSAGPAAVFGGWAGNGATVISEGKKITFNEGFAGTLALFDVTQKGSKDFLFPIDCQNGILQFRRDFFESAVLVKSGNLNFTFSTFNSDLSINTKKGYSDNCIYNGNCNLTVTESYGKSTEIHNGNLTFNVSGYVSAGNLTIGGNIVSNGRLGIGGYAKFVGQNQSITNTGETIISDLQLNSTGSLTLKSPVRVVNSVSLGQGIINTSASEILVLDRLCNVIGGSNQSFVNGPIKKFGNSSPHTLPVGKADVYKPITMTYSTDANQYTMVQAEYFNSDPTLIATTEDKTVVSNCEYWKVERTEGQGSASFSFPAENCSAIPEKDLNILFYDTKTSSWKTKTSTISNSIISLSEYTGDYGIYALGKGALEKDVYVYSLLSKTTSSNPISIKSKQLRFIYNEEYLPGKLTFNIYDMKRKAIFKSSTAGATFVVPNKVYGMNEISLDLSALISDNQAYMLEVVNAKNEKQFIMFKSISSN